MSVVTQFNTNTTAPDAMDTLNQALTTITSQAATIATLSAAVAAIPPLASFTVATKSQNEGNSGTNAFLLQINLDKIWGSDVAFEYVVVGSGANPADASDFVGGLPRGIVTFPSGTTQANISLPIAGDTVVEPNENFTVRLYRVAAQLVGMILNDDNIGARTTFPIPSGGSVIYAMDPDQVSGADGSRVTTHTDPLSGIVATATAGLGPVLVKNVNNGHAVLRFANVNTERLSLGKPAAIVSACATANDWSMIVVMKDAKGTEGNSPAFGDNFSTNGVVCMSSADSGYGFRKIRHDFAGATGANVRTFVYSGERIGTLGKGRQYNNGLMVGADGITLAQAYDLFIGYAQNNGTGNFQFNGDILGIYIMTGNLSAPEALQAHLWACNKFGEASPLAGRTWFPVFDGDSITYGIEATDMTKSFPSQLAVKRGWKWSQWANVGKPSAVVASSGTNANTMMDKAPRDVDGYADVTGLPVVLVSGEWYNQGGGGGTTSGGATLANNNRLYATTRKATGKFSYQLGWTSTASADRNGAGRDGFNASLMSNPGDYNSMVAMHLNSLVGVDAQGTNTTYINGAHPTNAGYAAMRDEIDTGLINAGYTS